MLRSVLAILVITLGVLPAQAGPHRNAARRHAFQTPAITSPSPVSGPNGSVQPPASGSYGAVLDGRNPASSAIP